MRFSVFIRYSEIIQVFLEGILRRKAGVGQIAFFPIPLLQSAVIEHFYAVLNNKRHDIVFQAFLEHNQPADTPIAVLKWVDALKPYMERKDIFKRHRFLAVILIEQPFHFLRHFFGQGRFPPADLIRQFFIIADGKPIFLCVACSGFQDKMQVLDEFLAELRFCAFDNLVNTVKVIGGFDDIVHPHAFLGDADGVCFENKARLIMSQAAALHVIGIVSELHLHLMINSAVGPATLFFFENIRQSLRCGLAFIAPFGLLGVFGNVPGLARQKSARDTACRAVVADAALGGVPIALRSYWYQYTTLSAKNQSVKICFHLWRLRFLLRLKGLELDLKIPQGYLAIQ